MKRKPRHRRNAGISLLSFLEWICLLLVVCVVIIALLKSTNDGGSLSLETPETYHGDQPSPPEDSTVVQKFDPSNGDNNLATLLEQARVQMQERGKEEMLQYVDMAESLLEEERMRAMHAAKDRDAHDFKMETRRLEAKKASMLREQSDDIWSHTVRDEGIRVTSVRMKSSSGGEIEPPSPEQSPDPGAQAAARAAESAREATIAAASAEALVSARKKALNGATVADPLVTLRSERRLPTTEPVQSTGIAQATDDRVGKEDDLGAESMLSEHGRRLDEFSPDHPIEASTSPQSIYDRKQKLRAENRLRNKREAEARGESPAPSVVTTEAGTLANPEFDANDDGFLHLEFSP